MFKWLFTKELKNELADLAIEIRKLKNDLELLAHRVLSGEQRKYKDWRKRKTEEGTTMDEIPAEIKSFVAGLTPMERAQFEQMYKNSSPQDS